MSLGHKASCAWRLGGPCDCGGEDYPANPRPVSPEAARCELPPDGWLCTRKPGHEPPCAAVPCDQGELNASLDIVLEAAAEGLEFGDPVLEAAIARVRVGQAWVSRVTKASSPDMHDAEAAPPRATTPEPIPIMSYCCCTVRPDLRSPKHWHSADESRAPLAGSPPTTPEPGAENIARLDALGLTGDFLGERVRKAWVRWAETQPNPKPHWLAPWSELGEADREADRQIGRAIALWTLLSASVALAEPSPESGALTWDEQFAAALRTMPDGCSILSTAELDTLLGRLSTLERDAARMREAATRVIQSRAAMSFCTAVSPEALDELAAALAPSGDPTPDKS